MKTGILLKERQQQKQIQLMAQRAQILQMSRDELNAYLEEFQMENPLAELDYASGTNIDAENWEMERFTRSVDPKQEGLEAADDIKMDDDSELEHRETAGDAKTSAEGWENWTAAPERGETLEAYLLAQLSETELKSVLPGLIACLDEQGYLREGDDALCAVLGCGKKELQKGLSRLRSLIPAGVGARDLGDCLELQLRRLGFWNEELAELLRKYLPQLAEGKYREICSALQLSPERLKTYGEMIRRLNPRPGIAFSGYEQIHYVIPDVVIARFGEVFDVILNHAHTVGLRWNETYLKLYRSAEQGELKRYLGEQIGSMRFVEEAVQSREETLKKISRLILKRQLAFFRDPKGTLKPLQMAELAEALSVDVSTVSRAIRGKYLQCSRGTYPMKFFFVKGGSQNAEEAAGNEACSVAEIHERLRKLLKQEPKQKPLSDQKLVELLKQEGCLLSRRTVAKYRAELGFPNAANRKLWR